MIGIDVRGFVDWLPKLGVGGLLALFLLGFQQAWWYFGREVKAMQEATDKELAAMTKDRDEWKARAETLALVGERYRAAVTSLPPAAALAPASPAADEAGAR